MKIYILQTDFTRHLLTNIKHSYLYKRILRGFTSTNNISNTAWTQKQRTVCLCVLLSEIFLTGNATDPLSRRD